MPFRKPIVLSYKNALFSVQNHKSAIKIMMAMTMMTISLRQQLRDNRFDSDLQKVVY